MIKLDIQEYCHDCPEFDPVVSDLFLNYDRMIRCSHSKRCDEVFSYIEQEWEEKLRAKRSE